MSYYKYGSFTTEYILEAYFFFFLVVCVVVWLWRVSRRGVFTRARAIRRKHGIMSRANLRGLLQLASDMRRFTVGRSLGIGTHPDCRCFGGACQYCRWEAREAKQKKELRRIKHEQQTGSASDFDGTQTYCISDGQYFKFGITTQGVAKRLRQLQTGHPKELKCIFLINADVEAELHEKFAVHRMHGEWFDLRGSQVDDVRELYKNILSQQNHDFD